MSRYGNLGAFDYRVTNVPQYDLQADIDKSIERGMKFGAMIGKGVKSSADARIARQKEIANQMAIDKIDATTKEGLILKADDDLGAMSNARVEVGNMFVDKLNQAVIARNDGRLTPADFSKVAQTLNSQVAQFKDGEKVLAGIMGQYMDSVENDNQSGANDPKTIEFLSAMSTGRAKVKWDFDENSNMKLTGTWTDADGNEQPIDAALSKFEQLPQVLTAPEHTAFEQRQADIANVMKSQQGAAMTKLTTKVDPVTGVPVYTSDINPLFTETTETVITPDKKKVKASRTIDQVQPWFRQAADDSFNGYFDSLGKGDLRMGLKSYLLDSAQSGLGYEEVSALIDGKKDKDGNIIKSTIPSLDVLKQIKENIKEEYMFEMLDETHQANKLAVEKQIQTDRGNRANIADEERKIIAAQQEKKELTTPKSDGKTTESGDELLNELQGLFNTAQTTESRGYAPQFEYTQLLGDGKIDFEDIQVSGGKPGKSGESKKITDPNNVMMIVRGGKKIKIPKNDLNNPKAFFRSYLAAKGVPTKPTKSNPKTIEWYMRRLDLDEKDIVGSEGNQDIAEKYNIDGSK
tara:strand:+ start:705 stop:2432 length:1728 start_codon:yes stop_codon:yes gene_type:complete